MKNAAVGWSSVPGPESALTPSGLDGRKAPWRTPCISSAGSQIAAVDLLDAFSPSSCDHVPQK